MVNILKNVKQFNKNNKKFKHQLKYSYNRQMMKIFNMIYMVKRNKNKF